MATLFKSLNVRPLVQLTEKEKKSVLIEYPTPQEEFELKIFEELKTKGIITKQTFSDPKSNIKTLIIDKLKLSENKPDTYYKLLFPTIKKISDYLAENKRQKIAYDITISKICNELWVKEVESKDKKSTKQTILSKEETYKSLLLVWHYFLLHGFNKQKSIYLTDVMTGIRVLSAIYNYQKNDKLLENYTVLSRPLAYPIEVVPEKLLDGKPNLSNTRTIEYEEQITATNGVCENIKSDKCNEYEVVLTPPFKPNPNVINIGEGRLLIVESQLIGYEVNELAGVVNVLRGETLTETHRKLDRIEEVTYSELEREKEESTELTVNTRFSMESETQSVINEQNSFEAGLNSSYSYGKEEGFGKFSIDGRVETSSNNSKELSEKQAQESSQDITSKAVQRIKERTKETRTLTKLSEKESKQKHELKGSENEHTIGTYFFVDKIYRSRVFDYGVRMMVEGFIPKPAALYIHLKSQEINGKFGLKKPIHPIDYEHKNYNIKGIKTFQDIKGDNYEQIMADFGVEFPIFPEKTIFIFESFSITDEKSSSEKMTKLSDPKSIEIPNGYQVVKIECANYCRNENDFSIVVGNSVLNRNSLVIENLSIRGNVKAQLIETHAKKDNWIINPKFERTDKGLEYEVPRYYPLGMVANIKLTCVQIDDDGDEDPNTTNNIDDTVFKDFDCEENWKRDCYHILMRDYHQKLREYEEKLEQATFGKPSFGTNPNENAIIIKQELKRGFIELLTSQKFESFDANQNKKGPNGYPEMCQEEALREGKYIQFIEQCFEFSNLTYMLYDYFWIDKPSWGERLNMENPDPLFKKFLESGYARVCVPVRPGYEGALATALATGKLPQDVQDGIVMSDDLFVSIAQIQQEQQGNSKKVPIGTPWEYKVPTNHVILINKNENDLCMKKGQHPDLPCFSVNREFVIDKDKKYCHMFVDNKPIYVSDLDEEYKANYRLLYGKAPEDNLGITDIYVNDIKD